MTGNRTPLIHMLAEILVDQLEREASQVAEPRPPAQNAPPKDERTPALHEAAQR